MTYLLKKHMITIQKIQTNRKDKKKKKNLTLVTPLGIGAWIGLAYEHNEL